MDLEFKEVGTAIVEFARAHQGWTPLIVGALAFGESLAFISLILPFFSILIALGTLIGATGSLNFWVILSAAAVGAALGDWLSYWLGWHYHKQIAAMWPLKNYPNLLPQGERFFHKWGAWAVVIGRFSGPLRASIPIVAGAVRMPSGLFQLANWTSAFLWAGVLLTFGDQLGQLASWLLKFIGRG
jgi:membrane protein DedA with SNARE-associated domain